MSTKKAVMLGTVVFCLILYIIGMGIIISASLAATADKPATVTVSELWVDLVAGVTAVLALNAGAYLGLPERRFRLDFSDPETARMIATVIYLLTIAVSFIVAATTQYPHPSLTDNAIVLVGVAGGVISVLLGRD